MFHKKIHRQDSTVKILEVGVNLKDTLGHRDREWLLSDHTAPPQASTLPNLVSPSGPMASPVGKREPKVDTQLSQYSGVSPRWPTWVLTHDGHRRICRV